MIVSVILDVLEILSANAHVPNWSTHVIPRSVEVTPDVDRIIKVMPFVIVPATILKEIQKLSALGMVSNARLLFCNVHALFV